MPRSRDDYKEAMRSVALFGVTAKALADESKWQRSSLEVSAVNGVLWLAATVGLKAQDVLDLMEENDE